MQTADYAVLTLVAFSLLFVTSAMAVRQLTQDRRWSGVFFTALAVVHALVLLASAGKVVGW